MFINVDVHATQVKLKFMPGRCISDPTNSKPYGLTEAGKKRVEAKYSARQIEFAYYN